MADFADEVMQVLPPYIEQLDLSFCSKITNVLPLPPYLKNLVLRGSKVTVNSFGYSSSVFEEFCPEGF